jgi:hypothetical protein
VLLAAALVLFGVSTLSGLSRPGLQYDELLFVNAALPSDSPYQGFIHDRFLGIPTLVMPYIGALKSWLYAPIFAVFGVSTETIRIPVILVGAATIAVGFLFLRRLYGPWPAALFAILAGTDPTFAAMVKADWGPIALSAAFRVGALAAYFALIRTGARRYMWLLAGTLFLGLFNKVDFLWFIIGLAVAALAVHRSELLAIVRRDRVAALVPAAAFALALAVMIDAVIVPSSQLPLTGSGGDTFDRLSEVWRLYEETMNGTAVYLTWTQQPLDGGTAVNILLLPALVGVLAVGVLALLRRQDRELSRHGKTSIFFLVLFAVVAVEVAATRQATGPHHVMLLWPLPYILLVSLLAAPAHIWAGRARIAASGAVAAAIGWLAMTNLQTGAHYRDAYGSERAWNPIWTPEIYPLARAVRREAPGVDLVVTADWGIGTQVFALGQDPVRRKFDDIFPAFSEAAQGGQSGLAPQFRGRNVLVLLHERRSEVMKGTAAGAAAVVDELRPRGGVRSAYCGRQLRAFVLADRAPAAQRSDQAASRALSAASTVPREARCSITR